MKGVSVEHVSKYKDIAVDLFVKYGPGILSAILTLVIGLIVISLFTKGLNRVLGFKNIDPSLKGFFLSLSNITLKVLLVITVLGMAGIEMTSFIAILGAAGLAIGMAFSGTLQNFASGVMILIFRPFKVGDFIEACGKGGTVEEIQVFNTILTTPDNKTIIISNSQISKEIIVNYSTKSTRRVEFVFGIGYEDDIDKAKSIIFEVLNSNKKVNKDPSILVAVKELADSSVNIVARAWVDSSNYWDVYFETLEEVKKSFDKNKISIPYPQRDIHLYKSNIVNGV